MSSNEFIYINMKKQGKMKLPIINGLSFLILKIMCFRDNYHLHTSFIW